MILDPLEKVEKTSDHQIQIPDCIGNKKATQICQFPKCQHKDLFLCNLQGCQCQKPHELCIKVSLRPLLKLVQNKVQSSDNSVNKCVEKIFNELIDRCSEIRDEILIKLEYLGLSENQRLFLIGMEKQKYSGINQTQIHEICSEIQETQEFHLQTASEFIENWWFKKKKEINQTLKKFEVVVLEKSLKCNKFIKNIESNIIQDEQIGTLVEMFGDRMITEANLLYRASEANFSIEEFHRKCDGIPNTVAVLRTPAGKVIGGFSTIPWNKSKNNQYQTDASMRSFVFSLTDNRKYVQLSASNTIQHYSSWGPRFGTDGSCDFAIGADCYANVGNLYKLTPPEPDLNQHKAAFVGGGVSGTTRFKAKDWEVFSIVFNE